MRLALHGATRCNPWIVLRKLWIAVDPRFAQDNPWIVPDPRFAQNISIWLRVAFVASMFPRTRLFNQQHVAHVHIGDTGHAGTRSFKNRLQKLGQLLAQGFCCVDRVGVQTRVFRHKPKVKNFSSIKKNDGTYKSTTEADQPQQSSGCLASVIHPINLPWVIWSWLPEEMQQLSYQSYRLTWPQTPQYILTNGLHTGKFKPFQMSAPMGQ